MHDFNTLATAVDEIKKRHGDKVAWQALRTLPEYKVLAERKGGLKVAKALGFDLEQIGAVGEPAKPRTTRQEVFRPSAPETRPMALPPIPSKDVPAGRYPDTRPKRPAPGLIDTRTQLPGDVAPGMFADPATAVRERTPKPKHVPGAVPDVEPALKLLRWPQAMVMNTIWLAMKSPSEEDVKQAVLSGMMGERLLDGTGLVKQMGAKLDDPEWIRKNPKKHAAAQVVAAWYDTIGSDPIAWASLARVSAWNEGQKAMGRTARKDIIHVYSKMQKKLRKAFPGPEKVPVGEIGKVKLVPMQEILSAPAPASQGSGVGEMLQTHPLRHMVKAPYANYAKEIVNVAGKEAAFYKGLAEKGFKIAKLGEVPLRTISLAPDATYKVMTALPAGIAKDIFAIATMTGKNITGLVEKHGAKIYSIAEVTPGKQALKEARLEAQKAERVAEEPEGEKKPVTGKEISDETFYDYHEQNDEITRNMLDEYGKRKGHRQSWDVASASRTKKIWADYAKMGFVRDEKGIDKIAGQIITNIQKINANNILSGHTEEDPVEHAQNLLDKKIPENYFNKIDDFITDDKGAWRISDYAIKELNDNALQLQQAKTSEQKLAIIDKVLNIVHQRSDLASWFIEGGTKTLNDLAAKPKTQRQLRATAKKEQLLSREHGEAQEWKTALAERARKEIDRPLFANLKRSPIKTTKKVLGEEGKLARKKHPFAFSAKSTATPVDEKAQEFTRITGVDWSDHDVYRFLSQGTYPERIEMHAGIPLPIRKAFSKTEKALRAFAATPLPSVEGTKALSRRIVLQSTREENVATYASLALGKALRRAIPTASLEKVDRYLDDPKAHEGTLSKSELGIVNSIRSLYQLQIEAERKAGIPVASVENYTHRLVDRDQPVGNVHKAVHDMIVKRFGPKAKLRYKAPFQKQRKYKTYAKGEEAGVKYIHDPALSVAIRIHAGQQLMTRKIMLDKLQKAKILLHKKAYDKLEGADKANFIPVPAWTGLSYASAYVPKGAKPGEAKIAYHTYFAPREAVRDMSAAYGPTFSQQLKYSHPELWEYYNDLRKIRNFVKHASVYLPLFHGLSWVMSGIGAWVNPITISKVGNRLLVEENPEVTEMIRNGLNITGIGDFEKAIIEDFRDMKPTTKNPYKRIQHAFWQEHFPNIKVGLCHVQLHRNIHRYAKKLEDGSLTMDDMYEMAAKITNETYGGLEWQLTHPKLRELLRWVLLGSDWTPSNLKLMVGAIIGLSKQPAYYIKFWATLMALVLGATSQGINLALTKKFKGKAQFTWDNPKGHKMDIDLCITDEMGNNLYFSVGSWIRDPYRMVREPRRFITAKLHPLPKITYEILVNRNYWGGQIWRTEKDIGESMFEFYWDNIKETAMYPVKQFRPAREMTEAGKAFKMGSWLDFIGKVVAPHAGTYVRRFPHTTYEGTPISKEKRRGDIAVRTVRRTWMRDPMPEAILIGQNLATVKELSKLTDRFERVVKLPLRQIGAESEEDRYKAMKRIHRQIEWHMTRLEFKLIPPNLQERLNRIAGQTK